jgi:hypothetical protein
MLKLAEHQLIIARSLNDLLNEIYFDQVGERAPEVK